MIILAGGVGLAALLLVAAVTLLRLGIGTKANPLPVARQSWLSPIQEYAQNESLRASGNWVSPIQEYALNIRNGAAKSWLSPIEAYVQNSAERSSQAWKSPIEEYISNQ